MQKKQVWGRTQYRKMTQNAALLKELLCNPETSRLINCATASVSAVSAAPPEKPRAAAWLQLHCSGATFPKFPLLRELGQGLAESGQRASDNCPSTE